MTDEIIPVEHQRGGATRLVQRSSVLYIKAEGDYVRIVADNGRYLVRAALSDLEHRWQAYGFVRVHRSYVANLRRAVEIRPELGGGATSCWPTAARSRSPVARWRICAGGCGCEHRPPPFTRRGALSSRRARRVDRPRPGLSAAAARRPAEPVDPGAGRVRRGVRGAAARAVPAAGRSSTATCSGSRCRCGC